jgi:hypothetical protein
VNLRKGNEGTRNKQKRKRKTKKERKKKERTKSKQKAETSKGRGENQTRLIDECLNTASWTSPRVSGRVVERRRGMKFD